MTQKSFPYLEAEGRADVIGEDAQVSLALCVRRAPGAGGLEPKEHEVRREDRLLTCRWRSTACPGSNAWRLAHGLRPRPCVSPSRTYSKIEVSILNLSTLASGVRAPRRAYISDVADLPPLDEDESEDTIDLVKSSRGSWRELQERVKEGQFFALLAWRARQAAGVAQLGLSIDDVKDAVLVAVDGAQCEGGIGTTSSEG